ncbi:uncharacterized protein LOC124135008 [Haliotis rufescens]|uniref:uncharacterized protein LOC124135008 n=1 Tax=Haliotis rufescens TaxID=6454 RepID=UPI00201F4886|nr:uncharacterized protein LOC124135008 [Haliotis rufescens]
MATFKWQIRTQRNMMASNVILMVTAVLHVVYGQTGPCVDFKDIPEVVRRNPNIATQVGGATINDRTLPDGWYGAANYALEESAPGFLRCGSLFPIWRQSISGTTATMCIQGPSNTCSNPFTVKVEDCNGYTVYNLKASPIHQSSYCFREITPNSPTYSPKPTVVPDTTDTSFDNSDLLFRCSFPPSSNQRLFHQTTWYVNDVVVHQHPPMLMDTAYFDNTGITQAKLSAEGITQIGFNITCEVRAMYGVSMPPGPTASSDPFYVGFEILTKEITIKQGETGQVRVRATAPFRCGNLSETFSSFCSMPIEIPTADSTKGFSQEDCAISIPYTQWNQPVSVTVHGTITPEYGRGRLDSLLVLRTPAASLLFPYWANHTIGTVKVTVLKDTALVRSKSCSSNNDPYVWQFDRIKLTLQMEGRFTLYKLASQLIEIQIDVQKCTRRTGYCNCGVAVQSGKTVFSINSCDTRSWRIQHHGCDDSDNAMEIKKRYSIYDIYLPTGARVQVHTFSIGNGKNALNVYLPGTILDTLASRGLCGQLSNTRSDDLIMRDETRSSNRNTFFNSWRVGTHDLFNTDYVRTLTTLQQSPKYCSCEGGRNVTCSLATMTTVVRPNHYKDVPCAIHGNRKKRMVPNRNIGHRYKRQTSTEVWNNQTAAEFCNNLFAASTTVQLCSNVPGVDINSSRDDCISDIMLSGTTDFQMMSIGSVRTSCETEVFLNPDLWVTDPNNPGAPTVLDTITNNVCPNDCSNRGTCNKGLCICSAGFGSADCSVDLTQPPVLDEAEDNGHCDLATRNCQMLTVFGLT